MAEPNAQPAGSRTGRPLLARLAQGRQDLAVAGSLSGLAMLAWGVPERHWDRLCAGLARLQPWRSRGAALESFRYASAVRGRPAGLTAEACARAQLANLYRERLQLLSCYGPARPRPRLRLEGREHLQAALAEGKGAILWVGPFVFSDLFTKVALHAAGFEVTHLSRYTHSFSTSRLGERLLNPIRTTVERRYLAERLVMGRKGSVAALRQLRQRLAANRIVSMSAIGLAHQLYQVPFLNGSISMAGGAPTLAVQSAAPLLPVFTGRQSSGEWLSLIEPPLTRRPEWQREEALTRLLLQYAALLEYYVTRWPDQFRPAALRFKAA